VSEAHVREAEQCGCVARRMFATWGLTNRSFLRHPE
jgi:hypothetical protein